MLITIKEIDRSTKKDSFDCGIPALDEYLKLYARQNHEKGLGKTYVAMDTGSKVLGYYTICTAQVSTDHLPADLQRKVPNYPCPAMRVARLAVDKSAKGHGLGRDLLAHALSTTLEVSKKTGIYLVIVDAKDDSAASFYQKYGFVQLLNDPHKLVLPLASIPRN